MKIAIDAGHGVDTAGKRSPDESLLEYEFNRDVASRLKKILESYGIDVLLTVTGDKDVSLANRCKIANDANADMLISIHANAFGNGWTDANGWEIFVLKLGGEAEKIAKSIETESVKLLGLKNRGLKTANFAMLRVTKMPSVLVEHGFYTNKAECDKLKSNDFRQLCAEADAKGILKYLGISLKSSSNVTTDSDKKTKELGCSKWAEKSCRWAVDNKIVIGNNIDYGWNESITKEQMCVMLERFYDILKK